MIKKVPFLCPSPPKLSQLAARLAEIERSGIFSNYGPVNSRFEAAAIDMLFDGRGVCVTVNNATIGLMLAIQAVTEGRGEGRRYALMPSFTFAATAHAALWCGFSPFFYDIEPAAWTPCPDTEERILKEHANEIAVIVPYATFGAAIDLARYERLSKTYGVPVVVDAAASLGTRRLDGAGFGVGFRQPVVFSMHATKTFSTGEGGLIYADDEVIVSKLRTMGNFGFGEPRIATMAGLNSKLSEISALLALARLETFAEIVAHRERLAGAYQAGLPGWVGQRALGARQAHQFMSVLLPPGSPPREKVVQSLTESGVGSAAYFTPHLAEHPYFRDRCRADDLSVTNKISGAILSLPMFDHMTLEDVAYVCDIVLESSGCR